MTAPERRGSADPEYPETGTLFGRDPELRIIQDFLNDAAKDGCSLLLVGDAGVGKTVLLDAAAGMASAMGIRVVHATGVEFEADISYAGLNQLMLPLSSRLEELDDEHRSALMAALGLATEPAPERLVVYNAGLSLLRLEAAERPLLLIIDDLPWLDRPSAMALGFVARRLSGSRIGLLAASRTNEVSFFDRRGLPQHEVPPLNDSASTELIGARFPTMAPRVRQRLLKEAQGNPLALLELANALNGPQLTAVEELPDVLPMTARLESVFASRIAELPARSRHALLLIALEGTGDLRTLQTAPGGDRILDDLAPTERAHLVVVDLATRRIRFRHPLVRSAVVAVATNIERRRVHRTLAELFADDPEHRAWHLAEASVEPEEEVAALLEKAAHRILQRGDGTGAIAALTRAAHLSPGTMDRCRRLSEAAYIGATVTGDLGSASRNLAEARRLDPELGGSLHAAAAAAFVLINRDGTVDTAHRLLVGAIESGSHGYDAHADGLVEALHTLLILCWFAGRLDFWEPLYRALDRLTPEVPESLLLFSRTFPDTARAKVSDRDRLASLISRQGDDYEPNRIVRVNTAAVYLDLLGECRSSAWRLVENGRAGGAVRSSLASMMHLCLDDFATGRWEEAQQLADEGLQLCRAHGYDLIIWYFLYHQALLAAVRGDDRSAQQWADELSRVTTLRRAYGAARFAHQPRTLAAIGRGDFEAAYRHACDISRAGVLAPYTPHALWVAMDLVEAAVRTNRRAEAQAHVRALQEAGISALSPRLALFATAAAAMVAPDRAALDLYAGALALPDVENWPFEHARVRLLYGERLRRVRATMQARSQLSAALSTFRCLGANPWINRASAELRAAGEPQPLPTGRDPVAAGLTAQESEIAKLAAQGLTNKQIAERLFLSPRTVSTHLYHIYPKLGITSRAALRDALRRQQDRL